MKRSVSTSQPSPEAPLHHRVYYAAKQALRRHATGGNILIAATVLALACANIPVLDTLYNDFWNQEVRLQVGDFNLFSHSGHAMTLLQFINDALMAVFFFTIGLEIKREVLVGELSSIRNALLPIVGAVGGMAMPVLIYWALSSGTPYAGGGAIPMATDIAFSLGILAMLGDRVPISLKIFLTTLAVVDDIGGIIVIAVFYSSHIDGILLIYAAALLVVLLLGSKMHIKSKIFYLGIGGVVWFLFLNSGIHPTIAGVLVALCVPATPVFAPKKYIKIIWDSINHIYKEMDTETLNSKTILTHEQIDWLKQVESASDKVISPLQELEDSLHPIVNFGIVPLFAFANAGIFLLGLNPVDIVSGVSLAVILGLVVGKFIGVLGFSWLAVKLGWAPLPQHCRWGEMAAVSALAGVGFTVSLFIANLTFESMGAAGMVLLDQSKLGIVVGSLLAGIIGLGWLKSVLPKISQSE
ncbi:MAG: Na+/H+ antiporter NhaA [Bacteroidales bacterium]|nr:Na+/H+ antiporter NhaA [Bacteroidales bacterium]